MVANSSDVRGGFALISVFTSDVDVGFRITITACILILSYSIW
jgi:hypothetical protein